jgi:hypothetical protein
MTDFRALCEELVEELEVWIVCDDEAEIVDVHALIDRARAALAENPVGPTDEELLELMPETMRDEFSYAAKTCSDAMGGAVKPGIFRVVLNTVALEYARAVLARWGNYPVKPDSSPANQPEPVAPVWADIHYAWELLDADGEWQAGGSANSLEDVQREGNRYLQTYLQDGPHKLIIQRHCVNTIEEVTND